MKTKKLTMIAAVIAALAISITSAQALTYKQVQEIKETVLSVPVPEMPAKAAELVTRAEKKDRHATAVTAVRAIIIKHRAAAPLVISAVSKAAPDLASVVAVAGAEVAHEQARSIVHAASVAAPKQAREIQLAVSTSVPVASTTIATRVNSRGSAANGTPSQGTVTITDTPINTSSGGDGSGAFAGNPSESGPGQVIYNQPPQ